jgi:hypothetical protein
MLSNIPAQRLTEIYDRFIITRSDFYYLSPHPPLECLDPDKLWVPNGADYNGITDRHLVVSAADLVASFNLIEDALCYPSQLRDTMIGRELNIEQLLSHHLARNGLLNKVRRSPYVMFLANNPQQRNPTTFQQVSVRQDWAETNDLISLRSGNLWLSAEPDGRLSLNRQHSREWENFRLIPDWTMRHTPLAMLESGHLD